MILGGKVTNPGELRTSVVLASRTVYKDAGGFQRSRFEAVATIWAKWVNVHGSEAWTANSVQATEAATVTIRYRSDVDLTNCLDKNGKIFEIVSIDNIQERNEYLELKVKRVEAG